MDTTYLILLVVFVSCSFIRTGYELLKDAGKIDAENKIIFAIIFSVMCMFWGSWFALCPADPFRFELSEAVHWSGLALFILGMVLAFTALFQLKGLENIDHLVTTGLFSKIRHPMYTGFLLWILGWSTYHGAIVSLAFGVIGIANILYWRRLEEIRLLASYGDIYEQYRTTTWF